MDRIEERIIQIIDQNAPRLQAMAEDIFTHAEQGFHEYRTAKLAADYHPHHRLHRPSGHQS